MTSENDPHPRTDPLVHSARREALLVVSVWLMALVYSITTCYRLGYDRPIEELQLVLGFPEWVFWGIVVPWVICTVFAWYFGASFIRDEHLGEDLDETEDELGLGG